MTRAEKDELFAVLSALFVAHEGLHKAQTASRDIQRLLGLSYSPPMFDGVSRGFEAANQALSQLSALLKDG